MSRKRTPNLYTINENVVTMVTHKGIAFTFDLEDLEKVKRYIWCENNGRIVANNKNKSLYLLSRLIIVEKNKYKPFQIDRKGFCYLLLIERSIFVHFYKFIPSEQKTLSKRLTLYAH